MSFDLTQQQIDAQTAKARAGWRRINPGGNKPSLSTPARPCPGPIPDEGPENVLQSKIMKWAKDWGKPCQCNRMSKKAKGFIQPGWPD